MSDLRRIVMLGATGAVGGEVVQTLLTQSSLSSLTLLGRRKVEGISDSRVNQYKMNIFDTSTYQDHLVNHQSAICTLGVGQPSKVSKEDFVKIDKVAVYDFAIACKQAGVEHFQLLSSVGINSKSPSFFLRTKGELMDELIKMRFKRLSIFQPSMILTPTNRYGFSQALTLAVWPLLKPILLGPMKPYRGVKVETLGRAIALNSFVRKEGVEQLFWQDFNELTK